MQNALSIVATLEAPAGEVYRVWTSPATIVAPVIKVKMAARIGGELALSTGPTPNDQLRGVFIAVEQAQRLRYTWSWAGSAEETLVTVLFHAVGSSTVVEIDHRGFLDQTSLDTHRHGWVSYLKGIATYL